ncbi:MAG: hypothetical protein Q4C58_12960 [Eubacteriales bacterium]|nr:hypothetical protein [Eubacteriales bacterium]
MKKIYQILEHYLSVEADFEWKDNGNLSPFLGDGVPDVRVKLLEGIRTDFRGMKSAGRQNWTEELQEPASGRWVRVLLRKGKSGLRPKAVLAEKSDDFWTVEIAETYMEYVKSGKAFTELLPLDRIANRWDAVMLHSSLICRNGKGIAFSGPSGVGKSTQAALWKTFENAEILNGDRCGIRKKKQGWFGYGLPYAGSSGIYVNESTPLSAIVVLRQAEENRLRRLSKKESFSCIYRECYVMNWDREFLERHVSIIQRLVEEVPVYMLYCRPDRNSVEILKKEIEPPA